LQLLGGQPENSLWGAGSGPDFRIGEQVFVDEYRNRLRVANRRDTTDGKPRLLTDKIGIRLFIFDIGDMIVIILS
jgi:hypothetical protein